MTGQVAEIGSEVKKIQLDCRPGSKPSMIDYVEREQDETPDKEIPINDRNELLHGQKDRLVAWT